jgi:hypothetical protein
MSRLSRRSFLLASGATVVLAACGGDDDAGPATTTTGGVTPTSAGDADVVLGVAFDRNGLLVTGIPQRATFLLFEASGGLLPVADAPDELTFELVAESGASQGPLTVARHGDDVDRAYYPVITTFDATGIHLARTTVDGIDLEFAVNVNPPEAVPVPQVGDPLPGAPTPTVAAPLGAATVCTQEPPCPLHEVSLDTALAEGRPLALLVSTPAFCQVSICGPVLDLLVDVAPDHADLAIIHLEVYPGGDASAESLSPVVSDTLQLSYEPALFVANSSGLVTSRLDNIYDGVELDEALRSASA